MTANQRWFQPILQALRSIETEEDLARHLETEDRRTEAALKLGPLPDDLIAHLYAQTDPLALVLRARLHIEDALDAMMARKFKHSEVLLQGRSYSFSVKMDLLRAANHLDQKMYSDLYQVSRLRNSYAHHLSSDIGEYDLSAFTDCAGLKAVMQKLPAPAARERLNIFLFRQIALQLLVRLTARHKLFPPKPLLPKPAPEVV